MYYITNKIITQSKEVSNELLKFDDIINVKVRDGF